MKIYIPAHLKKLNIIRDLDAMIREYSKQKEEEEIKEDSFDDYNYSLKNDPVQKFLSNHIYYSETTTTQEEKKKREVVIKYISKLFYSVKGTYKVFDYMKRYLNLNISSIVYNTEILQITILSIDLTDESEFSSSFRDFLDALLYFRKLELNIPTVNLNIGGEMVGGINAVIVPYKIHNSVKLTL